MNQEVKALKSELALLKLQFSERVNTVETRLNELLDQEKLQKNQQNQSFIDIEENIVAPIQSEARVTEVRLPESANEYLAINRKSEGSVLTNPSLITLFLQTVLSSLFDWLSPVTKIYHSYKWTFLYHLL